MHDYEPHPAAALFPMLGEDELQKLADDIRANGLLEPIVLYEGKVLDGRNRLQACKRAGVEPKFVMLVPYKEGQPIDGSIRIKIYQEHPGLGIEPKFVEGGTISPILYVLSKNLHRRHLTTSQRAAIAAEVTTLLREGAQWVHMDGAENSPAVKAGKTREMAAKELQVGHDSVQKALDVKKAAPQEFERVKSGEITVGAAHKMLPDRPRRRRRTTETRIEQIKRLAADGHRAGQIATETGVSVEYVRLLARQHAIQLPDKFIGKKPKLDVNRIIQETVIGAQGLVAGLDLVEGNLDQIDRAQVPGWVTVLAASIKTLSKLLNQLKEVCK
jgi:hypothetical protein